MLNELTNADKVVGAKQARRALASDRAKRLYLAKDADPQLTQPLADEAGKRGVEVVWADTMRALGKACGIAVGTSVCAAI